MSASMTRLFPRPRDALFSLKCSSSTPPCLLWCHLWFFARIFSVEDYCLSELCLLWFLSVFYRNWCFFFFLSFCDISLCLWSIFKGIMFWAGEIRRCCLLCGCLVVWLSCCVAILSCVMSYCTAINVSDLLNIHILRACLYAHVFSGYAPAQMFSKRINLSVIKTYLNWLVLSGQPSKTLAAKP